MASANATARTSSSVSLVPGCAAEEVPSESSHSEDNLESELSQLLEEEWLQVPQRSFDFDFDGMGPSTSHFDLEEMSMVSEEGSLSD